MDYITVGEAAEKWGVSPRSITYHLVAGRIEGAVRKGHMWLIPATSPKPQDRRRKKDIQLKVKSQIGLHLLFQLQ